MENTPTLVIGLGNPILGDDGVGWVIADKLRKEINQPYLEFEFLSLGGFSLMERMVGYKKVIIIDSISSGNHSKGEIIQFSLNMLPNNSSGHTTSSHDTDLKTALNFGRTMNIDLPDENDVLIFGIETGNVYDFSDVISPEISKSIPQVIKLIKETIESLN